MADATVTIAAAETERDRGLRRGVGLWGLTGSIVNGVVGAGIFALPAAVAGAAGSLAVVAYLAVAVAMGAVVLCFAEGGSRVPTSGGAYGTVEAAFGPGAGFLTGIYIWLASVLACGGIAAALADGLGGFVPALAGTGARLAIIVLVIAAIAWINVRGAGLAANVIAWSTAIKLVPLGLFLLIGTGWIATGHAAPAAAAPGASGNFAEAMLLALFAFCGMETPIAASGEVRDPARTVPRALFLGMGFVLVLYVGIQLVAEGLLGTALAGSKEALADGMTLVDRRLGLLLLFGAALSRLVWIGSDLFGAPRVLFAFGRDRLLPAALGRVHPATATPHVAIWTHAAVAIGLAASGTFVRLAIWSTLATAGIYFLACAAALVLRRRGVTTAGAPLSFAILPLAAIVGMASMVALVALAKWEEIAGFAGVTAASVALYAVMRPRRP